MENKLTLRLDDEVIKRAKLYARQQNISLSRLIESYLDTITREGADEPEITPLVKSLSGVIDHAPNVDHKAEYMGYLGKKYQ